MGRLGNISGSEAVKALQGRMASHGTGGQSVVMAKVGVRANLSIPQHKELSTGTLRALI
jgi:hypothetical protein